MSRHESEVEKVRRELADDPFISIEDYARLIEEAEEADERRSWELERDDDDEQTYKIIRFHFQKGGEVIETGLTLAEAQEHCNRDDTHGDGWFDGYSKE